MRVISKTIRDESIRFKNKIFQYERQDIKVCIYAAEKRREIGNYKLIYWRRVLYDK